MGILCAFSTERFIMTWSNLNWCYTHQVFSLRAQSCPLCYPKTSPQTYKVIMLSLAISENYEDKWWERLVTES